MFPSVVVHVHAAQALQIVPFSRESNLMVAFCHWGDNQRGGMGEGEEGKGTVCFKMPRSINIKINTFIKRLQ